MHKKHMMKMSPLNTTVILAKVHHLTPNNFAKKSTMSSVHDFIAALGRTNKTPVEIKSIMDESYGDKSLSISQVRRIVAKVRKGEDPKDKRRGLARKVRTLNLIKAVREMVEADRRVTEADVFEAFGITSWCAHKVLVEDLGLSKRSARWVPRLLTDKHKEKRIAAAKELINHVQRYSMDYLRTVVTTDETWISFSTPETKEQSKQWLPKGSRPPTKALKTATEKKSHGHPLL